MSNQVLKLGDKVSTQIEFARYPGQIFHVEGEVILTGGIKSMILINKTNPRLIGANDLVGTTTSDYPQNFKILP